MFVIIPTQQFLRQIYVYYSPKIWIILIVADQSPNFYTNLCIEYLLKLIIKLSFYYAQTFVHVFHPTDDIQRDYRTG